MLINRHPVHALRSIMKLKVSVEVVTVVDYNNESDYIGAKFYYLIPFILSSELCSKI